MSADNPLEPAWRAYLVTRDCLRIAQRVVARGDRRILARTRFTRENIGHDIGLIDEGRLRSDELVIVALWAEFERFLINYLQDRSRAIASRSPKALTLALHHQVEGEIEHWRPGELLDLFKTVVSSQRIGDAKNVKLFRDWVAHKNPRKPTPDKTDPQTTYALLSQIIADIQKLGHPQRRARREA